MATTITTPSPSFLTTTTTKNPIPPSSPFNHIIIIRRRSSSNSRNINRFQLKSTPTDNSQLLSSKISGDEEYSSISGPLDSGSDVVRKFYDGINSRNLSTVVDLIADDCVYEDLVFPQPFVGRKAILDFFEKFIYTISQDLQFVIDDISGEDTSAVGVTWHLEWRGKPFPFSKGCSFYRLKVVDGRRKIIYGRDIVEPAAKPGDFALVAIRSVTWLLQQFPQLADRCKVF
ncbi:hypothetical protein M8C21_003104 [Ambrosia artemisiifolia]|uniref:SnoaL-like domain-containing protein n=1 Tax=Ambrosia artemisiifolia TaxID=4212 RepID=A0AAD5DAS8_AMBAR|nr:hypothetical protein M8C21_003104 [Ambrosia artemisiifolia]